MWSDIYLHPSQNIRTKQPACFVVYARACTIWSCTCVRSHVCESMHMCTRAHTHPPTHIQRQLYKQTAHTYGQRRPQKYSPSEEAVGRCLPHVSGGCYSRLDNCSLYPLSLQAVTGLSGPHGELPWAPASPSLPSYPTGISQPPS